MSKAANVEQLDDHIDAVVDEVLVMFGGDARRAILGLIQGQQEIEAEMARTVSAGYVRRGLPRA